MMNTNDSALNYVSEICSAAVVKHLPLCHRGWRSSGKSLWACLQMPYFHKSSSHAEFPPSVISLPVPCLRAEISSWSLPRFFNVSVYYGCWKILLFLFRSNILSFFPTILYAKPEWAPFFLPLASGEGGSDSGRGGGGGKREGVFA